MSVEAVANSSNPHHLTVARSLTTPVHNTSRVSGVVTDQATISKSALSASVVEEARAKFEQRYGRKYTDHEAREMLATLADFVRLLIEWDRNPES